MSMTPSKARVIDPILTAIARGYLSPLPAAANALFPIVSVGQRGGRILKFGPDAFRLVDTRRAPGSATKRVDFDYGDEVFALIDHSLEGKVPRELEEEAAAVPGIDLGAGALRTVQNMMGLERENAAAILATTAANYGASNKATLTSTGQWSHASSDPATAISDAKEVIREQIGVEPNKLVIGPKVATALKKNPSLIAKISSADDKVLRLDQIAKYLDVEEIVVASATRHDGTKFVDVWGKSAVLAYTPPKSAQEFGSPSYGYTYQLSGYPFAEEPYTERNAKSWFYPYTDAYQAVLAGPAAGFLFSAAVA